MHPMKHGHKGRGGSPMWAGRGPLGGRGGFDREERGGFGGGGFGGGGGGGHGRGPGGRRGKRFAGEELRLMVLALLDQGGAMHGYQLIRAFAERSAEAYSPSPGVLYPLLTLLQDMALIDEAPGEGRTRSFALTDAGRAELGAGRALADAALARLAAMAEEAGRTDPGPVRRAMMNLRTAAVQRLSKDGGADDGTAFAIAALIDEAAQKIERL